MRVAIDATPLNGPWGGIRRYTHKLVESLARIDPANRYVLFGDRTRGSGLSESFENFPGSSVPRLLRYLLLAPRALREIDLFHGTNYLAPLLGGRPFVLTVHDLSVQLFPETHPRRRRLVHRALPYLCRRAAKIITDSRCTKDDLVRCYGIDPDKIHVVYLAAGEEFRPVVDPECLARVRAKYGLVNRFALYLGSLEPRKNLTDLIRAIPFLQRDGIPLELVIAGGGDQSYVSGLRREVRSLGLELGDDVHFLGSVDDEDLPALYSLCDVFAYPSLYEGFGLPPLEAMACGAPVVLTKTSALAELYEDCAVAIDGTGPEAIARALRRVFEDPELRDLIAERGRSRAHERSWDDTAAETLRVYQLAAESR